MNNEEEKKVDLMAWPEDNKPKGGFNKVIIIAVVLILIGGIVALLIINPFKKKESDNINKGNNTNIKISFVTNGGNEIQDMEVSTGQVDMLPIPSKEGYIFTGWYLEDETTEVNGSYNFTKETKLYAKWEEITPDIKTMEISFNSNGGTSVNSITLQCENDEATITGFPATPIKTNYVFDSWKDDKGNIVAVNSKIACNNITLNANWNKKEEVNNNTTSTTTTTTSTTTTTTAKANDVLSKAEQQEIIEKANCGRISTEETGNGPIEITTNCITIDVTCPHGYTAYGPYCYQMDNKLSGEHTCFSKYIDNPADQDGMAHTYEGVYAEADGQGKCLYGLNTSLRTYSQCMKVEGMSWVKTDEGYKCVLKEINDYAVICPMSGYVYLTPDTVKEITGTKPTLRYCYKYMDPNA